LHSLLFTKQVLKTFLDPLFRYHAVIPDAFPLKTRRNQQFPVLIRFKASNKGKNLGQEKLIPIDFLMSVQVKSNYSRFS